MTPRSEENAHPGTRSSSSPPQQTSSRSLATTPGPGHSGKHSNPPHKAPAATSTSQTRIKSEYDPYNVFHHNINIEPATSAG